ncbi:hypothetical protein [Brevibacterium casei]|uniref:hypothetical protein n=1 Tax=Brevibacterium casei TaxID=33889 RepID=UPI000E6460E7|nr:hypothetical protein [Brevibacterium casei]
MTATLNQAADSIVDLGQRIHSLESSLSFAAETVADLAAGQQTATTEFSSAVAHYAALPDDLYQARSDYKAVLG